jgi:hypothetical protein
MGNDNKKTVRFNIVDVLIIIAVIAIACAFLFRNINTDKLNLSSNKIKLEYELKVSSLQENSGEMLKVGEQLYNRNTDKPCGKITKIDVTPAELYVPLITGEIVKRYTPKRIDMRITVSTEGVVNDTGYYIDGYTFMAPSKELHVFTPKIDFIGVVQRIIKK